MKVLLSTAYWPNQHYFFYVLNSIHLEIEQFENYGKQSYRNRCTILSANGPLYLSIPVKKKFAPKQLIKDIEISYQDPWQIKHWRAITSAYRNAPYFEYFESEIETFYKKKYDLLLDYNCAQLNCILKILKQKVAINLSNDYKTGSSDLIDLRETIHPKKTFTADKLVAEVLIQLYYQTFSEKFEFVPNLSILDLIFNTGLETVEYLTVPTPLRH